MDHDHESTRRSLRRLAVLRQQVTQNYSVCPSPVVGNGELFVVLPEVAKALAAGDPVVALESTIVSHGMPYPQNLQTAREVEAVVRKNGAVPATIALMDGKIHVGLSDDQLARIAEAGEKASKTSRRDLASVLAKRAIGSTTVSATSWIAAQAGIAIFATGGIGGVHRGAEQTFDVSADLTELGRTEITVVCAGAKSLLDIPKTLEYLETQGVAVVGFKTNEFPAFFTPHSGQATPLRVDSAEEAAQLINKNQQISVGSGIVLAVPINTADAADAHQVEQAIQRALQDASTKGVTGRDITPFLLQRINQLTSGQSLKSNIALIKQNAAVAAQVASHLSGIKKGKRLLSTESTSSTRVVVVGGAALDISAAIPSGSSLVSATSNPGHVSLHPGGVGRNISECLARLGEVPFLISAVGDDLAGSLLLSNLNSLKIRTEGVSICQGTSTAIYNSFMSGTGELVHAISDMDIISSHITVDRVNRYEREIAQSRMLIVDANVSRDVLVAAASKAQSHGVPVWFEPISIAKCVKGVGDDILPLLTYISPNVLELHAMAQAARGQQVSLEGKEGDMKTIMDDAAELVKRGANHVIVTMGSNGVLLAHRGGATAQSVCQYHHLRPGQLAKVQGVTGAGDSLVGGTVWGLLQGCNLPQAIAYGMAAGKLTVESNDAVSPLISASTLATSYPLTYTSSVVNF